MNADGCSSTPDSSSTPCTPPPKQAKLTISQSKLKALLFDFVIGSAQPFSLVVADNFCKLVEGLCGGKKPLFRKTLIQRAEKAFQSMKGSVTRKLQDIQTVCTTADIWTSHHRSNIEITCHCIEPDTSKRKSAALAFDRSRECYTYDVITAKISEIHAAYQIQGKVTATVTDNGRNFVKAFREYGGAADSEDTDDVQFVDVATILEEGPEHQEVPPPHTHTHTSVGLLTH